MQTQAAQTAEGCGDMRGTLPACAPLANPYVPFQGQNPDRYTAGRALMKGTLFPGLDLPYRGTGGVEPRSADGMQSMQDLQAANFAITELGLYLDTHADDEEAVQLFNQYVEQYEMLRQQAEDSGMALTQMEAAAGGSLLDIQLDIVVAYGDPEKGDVPTIHKLIGVQFTEDPREANQGDKFQDLKLPFLFLERR